MAKEFFKLYLKSRETVIGLESSDSLNMKCLKVFEKYLFSYKWCHNDTEKQIFDNSLRGIAPNKMVIQIERNGVTDTLKPESVRSASSRLSRRFYQYFGDDFNSVLTSDATLPENRKKLNTIIAKCISMNDDFIFQNHYSSIFQNGIEAICRKNKNLKVPDKLVFSKEILDALTLFKVYDNNSCFGLLKELDEESIVLIYKVLITPEYFLQRAEVLERLDSFNCKGLSGVQSEMYLQEIDALRSDMKNKDNIMIDKDSELSRKDIEVKKLRAHLVSSKEKIREMTSKYNDLESEYQRLKEVARDDHLKSLKRIKELEQELANSKQ